MSFKFWKKSFWNDFADGIGIIKKDVIDPIGDAIEDAADKVADAFGKEGAVTNFVEDFIPGGGLVTAAVHAAAGHTARAELAAVKGGSSTITAMGTAIGGAFAGPAGAALLSGLAAGVANGFESGMRELVDDSVKERLHGFDGELLLLDMAIASGGSAAGRAAGKLSMVKKLTKALKETATKTGNGITAAVRKVAPFTWVRWYRRHGAKRTMRRLAKRRANPRSALDRLTPRLTAGDVASIYAKKTALGTGLTIAGADQEPSTGPPRSRVGEPRRTRGWFGPDRRNDRYDKRTRTRRGGGRRDRRREARERRRRRPSRNAGRHSVDGSPKKTRSLTKTVAGVALAATAVAVPVSQCDIGTASTAAVVPGGAPVAPTAPGTPSAPTLPEAPSAPVAPGGTDAPSAPVAPTQPAPSTVPAPPTTQPAEPPPPVEEPDPSDYAEWELVMTGDTPEGRSDEPILVAFETIAGQVSGSIRDPYIGVVITSYGTIGGDGTVNLEFYAGEEGTILVTGTRNPPGDLISGNYEYYYPACDCSFYGVASITLIRSTSSN